MLACNRYKFRVWDKANGRFIVPTDERIKGATFFLTKHGELWVEPDDDNYVFQLGSGVIDKNHREIYEGDIVRIDPDHMVNILSMDVVRYDKGEVKFINSCLCVCQAYLGRVPLETYAMCSCCPCGLEVIGNVYENPEMVSQPSKV